MSAPKLKKHDNGVYYIHWTEGRRSKRVSTGATEIAAAKAFLGTWLLTENQSADVVFHVRDLWTMYDKKHIEREVAAPKTVRCSWQNLEQHFGDLTLAQITQDVVDDYQRKRQLGKIGRPSKDATIRRELVALRACFGWCADPRRKIITPAQIPAFSLPPDGEPRDRWLRPDEIQRLLDAARAMRRGDRLSRGERFLWLALETAARKGAIEELTWDRVDFETGVIHYDVPGRRKTKKRRSSPPISSALRPILERAYRERINNLVIDHPHNIWRTVHAIAERAGVEDVSPHVLRHTAATHMARRGVPLWKIAGVLGNTMAVVERVYAKHAPDGLRDAVEAISCGALEPAE